MGGEKKTYSYELNEDHHLWLEEMAEAFSLDDESKALRVALDYLIEEGDLDMVFSEIRCRHCG